MKIGAQFYTLREYCRDLRGLETSMKKVADIGFSSIQLSGVCAYEGEWAAEKARENGLTIDITHYDFKKICNETESTIKHHDALNCRCIGIGDNPFEKNACGFERLCDEIAPVIPKINASGHKLMYHNHHWEFDKCDGKTHLEYICDRFTPDELGITLDTYWVQFGGGDVCAYLEKLKGRCECIHLKDLAIVNDEQRMASIGSGSMSFDRILKAAEKAGVQYALVEQDNCYGEDPFECLKKSYEYLKSLGY